MLLQSVYKVFPVVGRTAGGLRCQWQCPEIKKRQTVGGNKLCENMKSILQEAVNANSCPRAKQFAQLAAVGLTFK